MKTFFNVLYRRILYKIPFKWLLVLLVVLALSFASFSKANLIETVPSTDLSFTYVQNTTNRSFSNPNGVFCIFVDSNCTQNCGTMTVDDETVNLVGAWDSNIFCTRGTNISVRSLHNYYYFFVISDTFGELFFPQYTSLQCQTEYNLIPIDSVDQEYCTTNNLCPATNCPNVGVSNVFINDIFHPGAFNIVMNIPEEIDRDYAYTNSGNNMNIDVVGYNVDYEKMQEIIDLQNYKPTDEDFSSLVGMLAPYTKIIIFFVFLFIVWAWIKKPFKSKKL